MTTDDASFIGIGILIVLSCIISASEIAFMSCGPLRIGHLAKQGHKRAIRVQVILEKRKRFLSSILIANNSVNIAATALATSIAVRKFGNVGISVATAVLTLLLLIFGEITPKKIARERPEQIAFLFVPVVTVIVTVCTPFLVFGEVVQHLIKKLTGKNKTEAERSVTQEDLKALIEVSGDEGILEQTERRMLHNILQFTDLTVSEIMTPRTKINAVESTATYQEILNYSKETSSSRLPVYEKDIDHIIGIIYIKDFLFIDNPEDFSLKKYLRKAVFILDNTTITDMQVILKKEKQNMAIIFDEYGGTAGIATLEDIVEEVFGPINDEYDTPDVPEYEETGLNEYVIDGSMRIQQLEELLDLPCPSKYFDTVAGFFIEKKGEIPEPGTRLLWNNWMLIAEETENHRITKIRVCKIPEEQT